MRTGADVALRVCRLCRLYSDAGVRACRELVLSAGRCGTGVLLT